MFLHPGSILGLFVQRHGELTALHASAGMLWAITTAPDIVHSYVDDVVGGVARNLAARASSTLYTHVWALLASAASAIYSNLQPRLLARQHLRAARCCLLKVPLAATLDQLGRTASCADEMLSRFVSWLVLKLARVASTSLPPPAR